MPVHAAARLPLTTCRLARLVRAPHCSPRSTRLLAIRKRFEPIRTFVSASPTAEKTGQPTRKESSEDVRGILDACRRLDELNEDRLNVQVVQAQTFLENRPKDVINVTVCSSEHGTGADFVSALLDDPLSSDSSLRPTLLERWSRLERRETSVLTSRGSELASPFLARFQDRGFALEVTEVEPSLYLSRTFSHSASTDIPIFVLSPTDLDGFSISSKLSILDILRYNPHSLIVVDGPLSADSPALEKLKAHVSASTEVVSDRILVCDSSRALRGASILAKDGPTASAVRRFQEDMSASNISNVADRIATLVALGPESLRSTALLSLVKSSVLYGGNAIEQARIDVQLLRDGASEIVEQVLEEREKAIVAILGSDHEVSAPGEKGRIDRGMEQVASEVRPVVDGLTWTKLPFVVDDVSSRVDSAVEHALTRQFGNELMFQTGRLTALQEKFSDPTEFVLGSVLGYRTPLVENKLDQITSAPSYHITATSHSPLTSPSELLSPSPPALIAPLQKRSIQLSHATRALHLSAQRALIVSFGSTAASFTSGASLCAYGVFDIPSGIAASAVGSLLGLRWAVGSWAKARRRWWGAFDRVGESLERDLGDAVKAVLDQQVLVVPREECAEMTKYADQVEEEIAKADEYMKTMELKYDVERKRDSSHTFPPWEDAWAKLSKSF